MLDECIGKIFSQEYANYARNYARHYLLFFLCIVGLRTMTHAMHPHPFATVGCVCAGEEVQYQPHDSAARSAGVTVRMCPDSLGLYTTQRDHEVKGVNLCMPLSYVNVFTIHCRYILIIAAFLELADSLKVADAIWWTDGDTV